MPYKERGGWRGAVRTKTSRDTKWFPSKKEALDWEGEIRKELKSRKTRTITGLLSLSVNYLDYVERYTKSTYSHKRTFCRRILAEWGDIDVRSITPKMCLDYLDKRSKVSGNAANEDLDELRAMFHHFRDFYNIDHNPTVKIQPYAHEVTPPYVPPWEDILKIVMLTTGQDRVMIDVFRFTGARRSEVMRLIWEDINFDTRRIRLKTKKRKAQWMIRYTPMNQALLASLQKHWYERDKSSPYVFTHEGKPYTLREDWILKLCRQAGVKPFNYHSIRRAFASQVMATGQASMKDISVLLGHSSTRNTELYLRSINPNLWGLLELIEDPKDTMERHHNE